MLKHVKRQLAGIASRLQNAPKGIVICAASGVVLTQNAAAQLVQASEGAVTFNPSTIVEPVITGAVAAAVAAGALVILVLGLRWMFKMIKGSK